MEDEMGLKYEQKVEYEWKPPQCMKCGVFGHNLCAVEDMEPEKLFDKNDLLCPVEGSPAAETPHHPISNPCDAGKVVDSGSSSGEEKSLDDGWQVFRAKKKKSSGSGPPSKSMTRIQPNVVNGNSVPIAGERSVSAPHRAATAHGTSGQVCQPPISPHLEINSNFKSGPINEVCPITILEKEKNRVDSNGPQSDCGAKTRQNQLIFGGPPPKSSAGHTPFPSRLSKLARDLRLGKMGCGSSFQSSIPAGGGAPKYGPNVKNQAHKDTNGNSNFWADPSSNGPVLVSEVQEISGALINDISPDLGRESMWTVPHNPQHEVNRSLQPDSGLVDDIPTGLLDTHMKVFGNQEFMGSKEPVLQMEKSEKMGSSISYNSGLESEGV